MDRACQDASFDTLKKKMNKTQGLQLRTVSDRKINPLIDHVNTRGTYSDKTHYNNILNSVQRGNKPNFIFIAPILTKILAEIVKLIHL